MKIGPKYKIARRLGARVFTKTQTTKFSISGSAESGRGSKGKGKGRGGRRGAGRGLSEYGSQLIEKQKARYTYGLSEHQFARYVSMAQAKSARATSGAPHEDPRVLLYRTLELRLDNAIFRFGLTPSRPAARQLVSHGHARVNGRRVNIPSYSLKIGDRVNIRPASAEKGLFKDLAERSKNYQVPEWLQFDLDKKEGVVKALPQLGETEADIDFGSILEFYSRV